MASSIFTLSVSGKTEAIIKSEFLFVHDVNMTNKAIIDIDKVFIKNNICISVISHTPVILAITSLSKIRSPKYLRFNL